MQNTNLLIEILEMQQKLLSVSDNEEKAKALQSAIDFKTKSCIRYITYSENGDKVLCLINTENNSTIRFKVEKVLGGVNYENFHPETMFKPAKVQ